MSQPQITFMGPPEPAKIDSNGLSASLQWGILANSDVYALLIAQNVLGVRRGAVYRTIDGQIPNIYCRCQSVTADTRVPAKFTASGLELGLYIVKASFAVVTTNVGAQPGGPTRWSIRGNESTEPVDLDVDGHAILSSSQETPDPPLTKRIIEYTLHGEFYYPAPDELTAAAVFKPFAGTLNDRYLSFLGADRGSLYIMPFTTEPSDTGWVKMTVDIPHKPSKTLQDGNTYEGWTDVFPDKGTRQLVNENATDAAAMFNTIADSGGRIGQTDWLLNGLGGLLTPGSATVLRSARHYRYSDFSQIPFP